MRIQAIPTSQSRLGDEGVPEIQAVQIPLFLLGCSAKLMNAMNLYTNYKKPCETYTIFTFFGHECQEGSL